MALRAMLDSNGYKGSCLPYITGYAAEINSTTGDPMGQADYRIFKIAITNQTWLKKTTHNLDTMIYLYAIDIISCANFKSMTGVHRYVEYITLYNLPLTSFDFEFKYLKGIDIYNCKKVLSFPYVLTNSAYLSLKNNGITDLSGLTVSKNLTGTIVYLDSNNLTTLPVSFLQTLVTNGDSVSVSGNSLLCATPDVMAILDKIATGGKWRTTQKPCSTSVKTKVYSIQRVQNKSNVITVDLKGRLIKKDLRNFSIKKINIIL
jgi:hypothetical protein